MGLLYKYRACNDNTAQIFTTGCLHYSCRNDFNDPYDSIVCIDKTREIYHEGVALTLDKKIKKINLLYDNDKLEQIYQSTFDKIQIFCLSKNGRQIQMWAHYADNHTGLCLEFDDDLLCQSLGNMYVVHYLQEPYIVRLEQPDELNENILFGILCTKEKGWEYEQEIRLLRSQQEGCENKNYPFDKKALKTIYFGSQCTKESIDEYKSLCKKNGFEHVKFRQMVFANNGKFELEAKEI